MSPNTIPYGQQSPSHTQTPIAGDLKLGGRSKFTIGRSADNDLPVPYPTVSQHHAQIIWNEAARLYLIEDLSSSNGTFVNGKRVIRPAILRKGDTIQIGPMQLIYKPEGIQTKDQSNNIGLTAINLKQQVSSTQNLLQNISIAIQPREFVAIVGASGSGKSTLLNALSGFKPASDGDVFINGNDLYPNYDSYRSQIGYVPQSNIIHLELTVQEALSYSARLRLPPDMTEAEREKRIATVLRILGIQHCKDTPVHQCSGGEQKRVSIGAEYLTQPGLFFLDEATSGLDPGTETEIMTLLRGLADKGQTVLIVTHATKNIAKCHKILFLAKGYLIYYGSPKDALIYFKVNDFDEIYPAVARTQPVAAAEYYMKSQDYRRYIEPYIRSSSASNQARSSTNQRGTNNTNRASSLRQFVIFSQRNFNILKRDNKNLALMLLIAPIIGLMYFLFWHWGLFDATTGNARFALTNLFMAAMVCCLVGALTSMREIVKEAEIYKRERMVFLKIMPYVLSKVWLATLIATYSALVFLIFMWLAGGWPPWDQAFAVYVTMTIAIMGGSLMGLIISAVSDNQNITPLLLVLILVPQLLFGGIIPSSQIGDPGKVIGYLTTTKWTFDSLVKISGMGDDIVSNPNWSNNVFTSNDFPGIKKFKVPEIDMPEPKQPKLEEKEFVKPGDPPAPPYVPKADYQAGGWQADIKKWTDKDMKAWQDNVTKYQDDMEKYKSDITEYRDNKISNWQEEYKKWKEKRSQAIGEAEGTIKAINEDYGDAFRSNVITNWTILGSMIVVFFVLVLLALKRRDRI
jgi:ABC-type multidrug transport system ATPase subunit